MSSWERSRYIPWSRIPASSENLETTKERIFRDLQRETADGNSEDVVAVESPSISSTASPVLQQQLNASKIATKTTLEYSHMDLARHTAFGACIGTITGAVFGFMDGMRLVQTDVVLQKASTQAKGSQIFQGTTRSAWQFGTFFAGYHVLKYGVRIVGNEPGDAAEMGVASFVSAGTLLSRASWRPLLPYACMLMGMDAVHVVMQSSSNVY